MTDVPMGWVLTWAGQSWSLDDLTGAEIGDLLNLVGDKWEALSPASSPLALMLHIGVHMAYVENVDFDVSMKKVREAPASLLVMALKEPTA